MFILLLIIAVFGNALAQFLIDGMIGAFSGIFDISMAFDSGNILDAGAFNATGPMKLFYNLFVTGSNPSTSNFGSLNLLSIMVLLAYLLATLILVFQIMKTMVNKHSEQLDHPFSLGIKYAITLGLISFSYKLYDFLVAIGGVVYSFFDNKDTNKTLYQANSSSISNNIFSISWDDAGQGLSGILLEVVLTMVQGIFAFALLYAFLKFLGEIFERYVILGVLGLFSPIMTAMYVSTSTRKYFWSWFQMVIMQLVLMCLGIMFLRVFESVFSANAGELTSGIEMLALTFLLIAWLRTGDKLDSHLSTLGFTAAQSTGIFDQFLGAAAVGDRLMGSAGGAALGLDGQKSLIGGAAKSAGQAINNAMGGTRAEEAAIRNQRMNKKAGTLTEKNIAKQIAAGKRNTNLNGNGLLQNMEMGAALKGTKPVAEAMALGKTDNAGKMLEPAKNGNLDTKQIASLKNGAIDGKGGVSVQGKTKNGNNFAMNMKRISQNDANNPNIPGHRIKDSAGNLYAAQISGKGAPELLGHGAVNGKTAAQKAKSLGGINSGANISKSGAVGASTVKQGLNNQGFKNGGVIASQNGEKIGFNGDLKDVKKGMINPENGQFISKGSEYGKEGLHGRAKAEFEGVMDKNGKFHPMSEKDFHNSLVTSNDNAFNTGNMIKTADGQERMLAGGFVETNEKGQVAVMNDKGEKTFMDAHADSIASRNNDGTASSFNTVDAALQFGNQNGELGADVSFEKGHYTFNDIEDKAGLGIKDKNGNIGIIPESEVNEMGMVDKYDADGNLAQDHGRYMKLQDADGNISLHEMKDSDIGGESAYIPNHSVLNGIKSDENGRVSVSDIADVQTTDSGAFIQMNNGQAINTSYVEAAQYRDGFETKDGYGSMISSNFVNDDGARAMMLAENAYGGNNMNYQHTTSDSHGFSSLSQGHDRELFKNNIDPHFLPHGSADSIRGVMFNQDKGTYLVQDQDGGSYMLYSANNYDNISGVTTSINGEQFYVQEKDRPFQQREEFKNYSYLDKNNQYQSMNEADFFNDLKRHGVEPTYENIYKMAALNPKYFGEDSNYDISSDQFAKNGFRSDWAAKSNDPTINSSKLTDDYTINHLSYQADQFLRQNNFDLVHIEAFSQLDGHGNFYKPLDRVLTKDEINSYASMGISPNINKNIRQSFIRGQAELNKKYDEYFDLSNQDYYKINNDRLIDYYYNYTNSAKTNNLSQYIEKTHDHSLSTIDTGGLRVAGEDKRRSSIDSIEKAFKNRK